jgi:ABC-type multidrug transport system fused ATPase/permease subunit
LGNERPLVETDLFKLNQGDKVTGLLNNFEAAYQAQEDSGQDAGVVRALRAVHWKKFAFAGCCLFVANVCACLPPLLINQILNFLTSTKSTCDSSPNATSPTACSNVMPDWAGYVLVGILFAVQLMYIFFQNMYFWTMVRLGTNVRSTVMALVFRKSLKLSPKSLSEITFGEMVSLMTVDCEMMMMCSFMMHMVSCA